MAHVTRFAYANIDNGVVAVGRDLQEAQSLRLMQAFEKIEDFDAREAIITIAEFAANRTRAKASGVAELFSTLNRAR